MPSRLCYFDVVRKSSSHRSKCRYITSRKKRLIRFQYIYWFIRITSFHLVPFREKPKWKILLYTQNCHLSEGFLCLRPWWTMQLHAIFASLFTLKSCGRVHIRAFGHILCDTTQTFGTKKNRFITIVTRLQSRRNRLIGYELHFCCNLHRFWRLYWWLEEADS